MGVGVKDKTTPPIHHYNQVQILKKFFLSWYIKQDFCMLCISKYNQGTAHYLGGGGGWTGWFAG